MLFPLCFTLLLLYDLLTWIVSSCASIQAGPSISFSSFFPSLTSQQWITHALGDTWEPRQGDRPHLPFPLSWLAGEFLQLRCFMGEVVLSSYSLVKLFFKPHCCVSLNVSYSVLYYIHHSLHDPAFNLCQFLAWITTVNLGKVKVMGTNDVHFPPSPLGFSGMACPLK